MLQSRHVQGGEYGQKPIKQVAAETMRDMIYKAEENSTVLKDFNNILGNLDLEDDV